jgi:threonine dehydrogenase-like Zn-dependent dehydrogenase
MRAAIFNGPGAVEAEERPDPVIQEWYYRGASPHAAGSIGHEFIGVIEQVGAEVRGVREGDLVVAPFIVGVPHGQVPFAETFFRNTGWRGGPASARLYIPDLLGDVLDGVIDPGLVLDYETDLDHIADAYQAMNERRAVKSLVRVAAV